MVQTLKVVDLSSGGASNVKQKQPTFIKVIDINGQ
jgi:hypothetical protein